MPKVTFILRDGSRREIDAESGQSLMMVAQQNGLDIEGACGGAMACATCHVIVDPAWYPKLTPASQDESDMLDLAPGLTKTSRLGCQIKMTEGLEGLVVRLPVGS
ncbi:MAG: 2Fe-2S iron-sulfur cluster-binding protein [Bdellovibrionales bacterium]